MPFGDPGGNYASGGAVNQGGPSGPNSPGNMGNMGGGGGGNVRSAYSGSSGYRPGAGRTVIPNPFGAWDYSPEQLALINSNVNYTNNPQLGTHSGVGNRGFLQDPAMGRGWVGSGGAGGANTGQGGMGADGGFSLWDALRALQQRRQMTQRQPERGIRF